MIPISRSSLTALRGANPVIRFVLALLVPIGLIGCTTLPTTEFSTYKETFAQARKASEDVLIDYGVMRKRRAALDEARAAHKRVPNFDGILSGQSTDNVDHIAVRMDAWNVVARYNDLLTAMAEGKSADALVGAVDGLTSSLSSFPIAQVAASATEFTAFLAPLKPLLEEAFKEKQRRQFIEAVAKGSDLIEGKFLNLLHADIKSFYMVKYGFNDLDYQPVIDAIFEGADGFDTAMKDFTISDETDRVLQRFNAALNKLPRKPDGSSVIAARKRATNGTGIATAAQVDQINQIIANTEELVASALLLNAELDAYADVLTSYGGLINQVQASLSALRSATAEARPTLPRGENLQRNVILLREAFSAYKDLQ